MRTRSVLDLKIPPLALALATAAFMALLARAWPLLELAFPARAGLGALCCSAVPVLSLPRSFRFGVR
jgi:hypothetical protein